MQIFKNTNFDFLHYKWPFIGASLVLSVAGIGSMILHGGLRYGIDFKEGTQMTVKWNGTPPEDKIRAALSKKISGEVTVQPFTDIGARDEVVIGTERMGEQQMAAARKTMQDTMEATFGDAQSGKLDFNNAGVSEIADRLTVPLQQAGVQLSDEALQKLAADLTTFRDTPPRSGLISTFDQLSPVPGVNSAIISVLKQQCYAAPFKILEVQMVGPKVGGELRTKAVLATLYALGGMLVYIAFRFEWIYGVAAVVACFHDTIITIGLFSLFNKEITLTVIAALLTLVGYSMNDTIVIFDRIRENLKILRREPLESLINKSVNQTLSRTIMTSGLTFLTVIALFLFGGPVLHGFSFALVVGIIIGTYSSVFVASPIVLFWHNWADNRKRTAPAPVAAAKPAGASAGPARKSPAKAVK
ncbi:MAG TPA: protein translocase subunit SecF [Bryobacteraceae bacterium]|nr:protein translocase subunit SecF [Bryobacteraceae bacterium]